MVSRAWEEMGPLSDGPESEAGLPICRSSGSSLLVSGGCLGYHLNAESCNLRPGSRKQRSDRVHGVLGSHAKRRWGNPQGSGLVEMVEGTGNHAVGA